MKSDNMFTSFLLFLCFVMYAAKELKSPCKQRETVREEIAGSKGEMIHIEKKPFALNEKYKEPKSGFFKSKKKDIKQTIAPLKNKQHKN